MRYKKFANLLQSFVSYCVYNLYNHIIIVWLIPFFCQNLCLEDQTSDIVLESVMNEW